MGDVAAAVGGDANEVVPFPPRQGGRQPSASSLQASERSSDRSGASRSLSARQRSPEESSSSSQSSSSQDVDRPSHARGFAGAMQRSVRSGVASSTVIVPTINLSVLYGGDWSRVPKSTRQKFLDWIPETLCLNLFVTWLHTAVLKRGKPRAGGGIALGVDCIDLAWPRDTPACIDRALGRPQLDAKIRHLASLAEDGKLGQNRETLYGTAFFEDVQHTLPTVEEYASELIKFCWGEIETWAGCDTEESNKQKLLLSDCWKASSEWPFNDFGRMYLFKKYQNDIMEENLWRPESRLKLNQKFSYVNSTCIALIVRLNEFKHVLKNNPNHVFACFP
jgi:hypothetical protein